MSINEFSIAFLTVIIGSLFPVLSFYLFSLKLSMKNAFLAALALGFWHGNIFQSCTAALVVLQMGGLGIFCVLIFLTKLIDKPSKKYAIGFIIASIVHFCSSQTAILLFPITIGILLQRRKKIPQTMMILKSFLLFAIIGIIFYLIVYWQLHNPFVTIFGKILSKKTGSEFAFIYAFKMFFVGFGYLSTAVILAGSFFWFLEKQSRDLLSKTFLVAGIIFFIPLIKLSKATIISAYAYEAQLLIVTFGIYCIAKTDIKKIKPFVLLLSCGLLILESVYCTFAGWPAEVPALGIYRYFGLDDINDMAKASGMLIRKAYQPRMKIFTVDEPIVAYYYSGDQNILALNDPKDEEITFYFEFLKKNHLADLAVIPVSILGASVENLSRQYCVDFVIRGDNAKLDRVIIDFNRTNCSTKEYSSKDLSGAFNIKYNKIKDILPVWVPFPPPDLKAIYPNLINIK